MREIKFRAWDIQNEAWINQAEISINGLGDYAVFDEDTWFDATDNDMKVMQFTGLKDKNGKEIYEGDIVKAENCYQDNYIVEWSSPSFFLFDGKDGVLSGDQFIFEDWERLKIIGNIHEDPELLEGKNDI